MNKELIENLYQRHEAARHYPSRQRVGAAIEQLFGQLFPQHAETWHESPESHEAAVYATKKRIENCLSAFVNGRSKEVLNALYEAIPALIETLEADAMAILDGDPAAKDRQEVIACYPGFLATAFYRIAHILYLQNVPLMPRLITEYAHAATGIDIHPAAKIGSHFFIDHGTGVVIGETSVIGNHVKLYQGVTLGALSISKSLAASKRHPTIEDHVVIYAGATILGGKTTVGHNSIIGGNVWLTHSTPPYSKLYYKESI